MCNDYKAGQYAWWFTGKNHSRTREMCCSVALYVFPFLCMIHPECIQCLFLFLFVAYEHCEAPSKVGEKFGERETEEWAKRSFGAVRGFVRAYQSQFAGYLFAVLVIDLIYPAKTVAMWSKMTRHMKTWFCAGKSLLKPVYPTRYYKVIWTECKLFLKV